jgi:hypothetical protein
MPASGEKSTGNQSGNLKIKYIYFQNTTLIH